MKWSGSPTDADVAVLPPVASAHTAAQRAEAADEPRDRFALVVAGACAVLPAIFAVVSAPGEGTASHDEALVRAVGLGFTGVFHGVTTLVSSLTMLVPVGARTARPVLSSAMAAGASGLLLFLIGHAFVRRVTEARFGPPSHLAVRLVVAVTGAVTLACTLGPAWQLEAAAAGGATTAATLVLAVLLFAFRKATASLAPLALALGLALAEAPYAGAAACAAAAPWLERALRGRALGARVDAAMAFALGLAPLGFAAALRTRGQPVAFATLSAAGVVTPLPRAALEDAGAIILGLGAAGALLAAFAPEARRWLASLLGVITVGVLAAWRGPAAWLAALGAAHVLAAAAGAAVVLAIARARIAFAAASAALVVVLELVLPVRAADETATRWAARPRRALGTWDAITWGLVPPASVIIASDPALLWRASAARASGHLRADVLVVPWQTTTSKAAMRALRAEPKLAALYRDLALGSPPDELSFTRVAAERPLLLAFDPRWDRALARHLVPVGPWMRFEPEPRGASDRRKAMDDFVPWKERLVAAVPHSPGLGMATSSLLRARALGMAAASDRELLTRALDDLRPFAPLDPVATELVRRLVTTRGPIDVRDLAP